MKHIYNNLFSMPILLIWLAGCGTPSYVAEKIHKEAVIHEGYLRHLNEHPSADDPDAISREKLIEIIEADAEAWAALDDIVNAEVAEISSVVSSSGDD